MSEPVALDTADLATILSQLALMATPPNDLMQRLVAAHRRSRGLRELEIRVARLEADLADRDFKKSLTLDQGAAIRDGRLSLAEAGHPTGAWRADDPEMSMAEPPMIPLASLRLEGNPMRRERGS